MRNHLLLLSRDSDAVQGFQSGVSLHGHTRHSQESLGFIGKFLQSRRPLRSWIEGQKEYCRRTSGIVLDFDRAYWTPPLCERRAFALESRQIQEMGLRPMVSLSDHDNIDACTLLRSDPACSDVPISTEWTVPFGSAVFHLGVHNLPAGIAQSAMAAMWEATARADEHSVLELMAEFSAMPGVLLVFNHPLWNFDSIAPRLFDSELARFLDLANDYLHAFELNGMRSHRENRAVLKLAADREQVIISGGDRHGCEPNAFLNLTQASDFPEFVDEIRTGRQSTVLIMPQYGEPLSWRFYQNFTHVIAEYPQHPEGRRQWDQRTFHPDRDGNVVPMIELWRVGPPDFLRTIFAAALMAVNLPVRGLLRRCMSGKNESLLPPSGRGLGWTAAEAGAVVRSSVPEPDSLMDFAAD